MSTPRDDVWRAATFDAERARLTGLAYRLLGSLSDAEDVVQEAWIRWSRTDVDVVERPAAWLTTTVSRLGLDRLRARRRERTDYVGPWLPEPFVQPLGTTAQGTAGASADPADVAELADSLTTAFLLLLERLSPEERLVVLLAYVFAEPFGSVADAVGRSPDATRQLAVRARRKLRDAAPAGPPGPRPRRTEQLAVATAFAAAVMDGDVDAVRALLHPVAVLTSDGGAHRRAARRPVVGPDRIARFLVNLRDRLPEGGQVDAVWVNDSPGLLVSVAGRPYLVHALEVSDGRVARQYLVLNPEKLAGVGRDVELS
ncbi:MAG: RNA polymerase sigma factor SigJ [Actinomycetes bacterium]